jgi:hypothetical protein
LAFLRLCGEKKTAKNAKAEESFLWRFGQFIEWQFAPDH